MHKPSEVTENFDVCVRSLYPKAKSEWFDGNGVEKKHAIKWMKVNLHEIEIQKGVPCTGIMGWLGDAVGTWVTIQPKMAFSNIYPVGDNHVWEYPVKIYFEDRGDCCICGKKMWEVPGESDCHRMGPPPTCYDIGFSCIVSQSCCTKCKETIEGKGMTISKFWWKFYSPIWDFFQYNVLPGVVELGKVDFGTKKAG